MLRRAAPTTLTLWLLAVAAPAASAQSGVNITDPEAGSPSGAMYQIPTERGRGDAAPSGGAVSGGRGGGTGGTSSGTGASSGVAARAPVHAADGGFGTSPIVPGPTRAAGSDGPARAAGSARNGKARQGSAGGAAEGNRQAIGEAGGRSGGLGEPAPAASSSFLTGGGEATHRPLVLLVLATLVGVGVGLAARRAARAG